MDIATTNYLASLQEQQKSNPHSRVEFIARRTYTFGDSMNDTFVLCSLVALFGAVYLARKFGSHE